MQHDTAAAETSKASAGPLSGIFQVDSLVGELRTIHSQGLDTGEPPGWLQFGRLYRVKRGMMTIVTGIPSSGKSEFVDALFVNLANKGWRFAMFSPENYPISLHAIKIIEKYIGKQYRDSLLMQLSMNKEQIAAGMEFLGDHFTWIYPDSDKEAVTLDTILAKALTIHTMTGIDGLLIDPWNELEGQRGGMSETDFISESLTKVRRWARKHNIHVWIVAHPMKLQKNKVGKYDPPTPYDISGSAHWRNKADFCICVHREDLTVNSVLVFLQKAKFKHLGKVGAVEFTYDYYSGRFTEVE